MPLLSGYYETQLFSLSGMGFIFFLLPLFLAVYYILPARFRPVALLFVSVGFYYLIAGIQHLVLMVLVLAADYLAVLLIIRYRSKRPVAVACLLFCVLKCAGVLLWLALSNAQTGSGVIIGHNIYALSGLWAVVNAYQGSVAQEGASIRFGICCCFFPLLYAGPVCQQQECCFDNLGGAFEPRPILRGASAFIVGAFQSAVLGGELFRIALTTANLPATEATLLSTWLRLLCTALSLYYMLSGCNKMAQGLGVMFGVQLPSNTYYPFQSPSVEDFFDRLHRTLRKFLQHTIYSVLPSVKAGSMIDWLAVIAVGALFGMWFGLRLNMVLWGSFLALFILMERHVYPKLMRNTPMLFRRMGTAMVVLLSFALFCAMDMAESIELIRAMFGVSRIANPSVLYILSTNWLWLASGCFFATSTTSLLMAALKKHIPQIYSFFEGAAALGLLTLLIAFTL